VVTARACEAGGNTRWRNLIQPDFQFATGLPFNSDRAFWPRANYYRGPSHVQVTIGYNRYASHRLATITVSGAAAIPLAFAASNMPEPQSGFGINSWKETRGAAL